jgi:hypothetical protein
MAGCRVRVYAVPRCAGGVGRADRVGSAGAGPVHWEYALEVAIQDQGQGVLVAEGLSPSSPVSS